MDREIELFIQDYLKEASSGHPLIDHMGDTAYRP